MRDTDLLDALETIASQAGAHARVADPAEIRERGAKRRKHRNVAVLTAAAVTAVAAGGVAIGLTRDPAAPEEHVAAEIAESMLLTVDDLKAEFDPPPPWRQLAEPAPTTECAPTTVIMSKGATKTLTRSFTVDDVHGLDQLVAVYPNADAADQAFDAERGRLLDCVPGGGELLDAWTLTGVGDEGVLTQYRAPDTDPESALITSVRLARTGRVVTSVTDSGRAQDWGVVDYGNLVIAVERLCGPAEGKCVQKPKRERIFPEHVDFPGFLQPTDLPKFPGDEWDAGAIREPEEKSDFETTCEIGLLHRSDPQVAQERHYSGTIDDSIAAITVTEVLAKFAREADAERYIDNHRTAYENCDWGEDMNPVRVDVGFETASAWALPEIGLYVAAVQVGDRAVILQANLDKSIDQGAFRDLVQAAEGTAGEWEP